MPPSAVKSVRQLIHRQYAKIIAAFSGTGCFVCNVPA